MKGITSINLFMLKPKAFANAIALTGAIAYVAFYILALAMPGFFNFLFNAQFFGADIARFVPVDINLATFLSTLFGMVIVGWIFGYLMAGLYNHFE